MRKLIIIIALILTACAPAEFRTPGIVVEDSYLLPNGCTVIAPNVCRVDDPAKDVSCYVYYQTAISCVKTK